MNLFGKRLELYEIYAPLLNSNAGFFYLTSNSRTVYRQTRTYVPSTITRSAYGAKTSLEKQNVTITLSSKEDAAKFFLTQGMDERIEIRIFDWNGIDQSLAWRGRLISVKENGGKTTLEFENSITQLQQMSLHRKTTKICPFLLYGSDCTVPEVIYTEDCKIVDTNGLDILIERLDDPAFVYDDGALVGGYITYYPDVITNQRKLRCAIVANFGNILTLSSINTAIKYLPDATIKVSEGCDKSPKTCSIKFDNIENFGGMPYLPDNNPFEGAL